MLASPAEKFPQFIRVPVANSFSSTFLYYNRNCYYCLIYYLTCRRLLMFNCFISLFDLQYSEIYHLWYPKQRVVKNVIAQMIVIAIEGYNYVKSYKFTIWFPQGVTITMFTNWLSESPNHWCNFRCISSLIILWNFRWLWISKNLKMTK